MLLPGCGPQKDLHKRGDAMEIISSMESNL